MEKWRTLFRRDRAIWSLKRWRLPGGALLAAVLGLFILISRQVAQACPPGTEHGMHSGRNAHTSLVNLAHKPRPAVSSSPMVAPFGLITSRSTDTSHGGGCNTHSCPCGCQTGCCSAGSAAIDVTISGLDLPKHSDLRLCVGLSGFVSHEPPPQFRPPRI